MKTIALATTLALAIGSTPAHAVLQLAVQAGATSFFCADNTACDTNPALGVLSIGDQTIGGVTVNGSIQTSVKGHVNILNTSSLSIINSTGAAITTAAAISDTDFAAPITGVAFAGAGTWQEAVGSTASLEWFLDPANVQGAATAFDTPGTLIGAFVDTPLLPADSFSTFGSTPFFATGPFSMTEATSGVLSAGAELINRGQTEIATIPEPSTWAMLVMGGLAMAWAGVRRRGKSARFAL